MQYKQIDDTYFVYFQKGEPVIEYLTEFCKELGIQNGQLSGIGAVNNIELGAYFAASKTYTKQVFNDNHELISCQGNILLKDGEPFIHAHITIGNHDMEIHGGHLFEMTVAVVGEFIIRKIDGDARRELDEDIGLATWCLE